MPPDKRKIVKGDSGQEKISRSEWSFFADKFFASDAERRDCLVYEYCREALKRDATASASCELLPSISPDFTGGLIGDPKILMSIFERLQFVGATNPLLHKDISRTPWLELPLAHRNARAMASKKIRDEPYEIKMRDGKALPIDASRGFIGEITVLPHRESGGLSPEILASFHRPFEEENSSWTYGVFGVDWTRSDDAIKKRFAHWLEIQRTRFGFPESKGSRGQRTDSTADKGLKALACVRLAKAGFTFEQAMREAERHVGQRIYRYASEFSEATQETYPKTLFNMFRGVRR